MAQTYYMNEALTVATRQLSRNVEDELAVYIANLAQNVIWTKYDWRETISQLPPFYLIPNEQEYGPPSAIIPADLLGLRQGYLVNTSSAPSRREELKVRHDIRLTNVPSLPSLWGYEASTKRIRLFPRTPSGIGATDWIVDGTYKIRPPKIAAGALQSTLIPWDDLYLSVFVAALKWAAYDAAGDKRAGDVQYVGGRAVYTGQLATMHALIDEMASNEGLNQGDPAIAPSESLVYPGGYGSVFTGLGNY
jgi:hypothetical protein